MTLHGALPLQHQPESQAMHSPCNSISSPHSNGRNVSQGPMMVPRPPGIDGDGYLAHMAPGRGAGAAAANGMNFSRSPPHTNTKNTKHVPCKFFRQGQCTAGDSCPYSHAMEAPMQPCQYFLNGNCKYGAKCMLPHIDRLGNTIKPAAFSKGAGRHSLGRNGRGGRYMEQMPQQHPPGPMGGPESYHYPQPEDLFAPHTNQAQHDNTFVMDDNYGYNNTAALNSPTMSPQLIGVSALDVTLPASFSSQDAPFKFGPNAASVPSRWGWDPLLSTSPTTSTARQQAKAFGNLDSVAMREPSRVDQQKDLASSPPSNSTITFPRKIMHSETRSKPQNISSSLPVPHYAGGPGSAQVDPETLEEDLVPSSLNELLTDHEISRRLSRGAEDGGLSPRQSLSALGSPTDSKLGSPKYGSPSHTSRYGALFARQHEQEGELRNSPSAFGHVGSPLRNSSLSNQTHEPGSSPAFGPISPPGPTARMSAISSLSEQLRRTRVTPNSKGEVENATAMQASNARNVSNGSSASVASSNSRLDRAASGTKAGPQRIDHEDYLFSMEEDEKERAVKKEVKTARPKSYADIAADDLSKPLSGLGDVGGRQATVTYKNGEMHGGQK